MIYRFAIGREVAAGHWHNNHTASNNEYNTIFARGAPDSSAFSYQTTWPRSTRRTLAGWCTTTVNSLRQNTKKYAMRRTDCIITTDGMALKTKSGTEWLRWNLIASYFIWCQRKPACYDCIPYDDVKRWRHSAWLKWKIRVYRPKRVVQTKPSDDAPFCGGWKNQWQ